VGTIQVIRRFDTPAAAGDAQPVRYTWQEALTGRGPEQSFTLELERAAGLPAASS
jgi:hypothetical protein